MKHIYTLIGLGSLLIIGWFAGSVLAQAPQPTTSTLPTATETRLMAISPTAITPMQKTSTAMPYELGTPVPSSGNGQGMGMQMGKQMGMRNKAMMGGGKMGSRMGMQGSKMGGNPGGASAPASSAFNPMNVMMMPGSPDLYDGIARWFGMTSQALYNQMKSGKLLVQIANERGITQQQLNDAVMAGYIVAPDLVLSQIFNHNLTNYKLTGEHALVPCSQCHINNLYSGTPTNCIVCHAKDDVHRGKYGTDCASCHTTDTWKK